MKIILLLITLSLLTGCTSVCDKYDTVVGVETEVIPSIGRDDFYYHYEFESGDKEIREYKTYTIGQNICVKRHYE